MEPPNICLCGTQSGYPHKATCPRPLYRCTKASEQAWETERDAKMVGTLVQRIDKQSGETIVERITAIDVKTVTLEPVSVADYMAIGVPKTIQRSKFRI